MKDIPLEDKAGYFFREKMVSNLEFFVLSKGAREQKLIKLVIIAHGYSLLFDKKPICRNVYAWKYGPVISFTDVEDMVSCVARDEAVDKTINDYVLIKLLEHIWAAYGHLSAYKLSSALSQNGSFWDSYWYGGMQHSLPRFIMRTYREKFNHGRRKTVIPDEVIVKYYQRLYENSFTSEVVA